MNTLVKNERESFLTKKIDGNLLLLGVLFLCVFIVLLYPAADIVLGPVMALLMFYLFFSGYSDVVSILILVVNDDLGTIFLGSLSFPYLLMACIAIRILSRRKFSDLEIVFLLVALILQLELFFVGYLPIRGVIYSMAFILTLISFPRDEKNFTRLLRGLYISVFLLALHACITGGVEIEVIEEVAASSEEAVVRRGIKGVGIGDPNFSAFLLVLGMIATWCDKALPIILKVVITAACVWALVITASVSGFLILMITLLLSPFLGKKKHKGLFYAVLILIILVSIYNVYISLPTEMHLEPVDGYIQRVEEKWFAAESGDYDTVTTNRSSIASFYLDYIFNQPILGFFLGGNPANVENVGVPHNTYISLFLQVGLIGFCIVLFWILYRFYRVLKDPINGSYRSFKLLAKILCLFMSFNLSFHQGSLWSLWLYILLLL